MNVRVMEALPVQEERHPITTYEQAVWRLVEWDVMGAMTDQAVKLVADIYWYSDSKVRHDVARFGRQI